MTGDRWDTTTARDALDMAQETLAVANRRRREAQAELVEARAKLAQVEALTSKWVHTGSLSVHALLKILQGTP